VGNHSWHQYRCVAKPAASRRAGGKCGFEGAANTLCCQEGPFLRAGQRGRVRGSAWEGLLLGAGGARGGAAVGRGRQRHASAAGRSCAGCGPASAPERSGRAPHRTAALGSRVPAERQRRQSPEKVQDTSKMSASCGGPEDAVKQRGRDGKMRREDVGDSQPEGKRLKLGNEGANTGKDRGAAAEEITPCLGREEPVPDGGGEGKSVSEDAWWL